MPRKTLLQPDREFHVSLVAIPEVLLSTLTGIYDVFNSFDKMEPFKELLPDTSPFRAEIVGPWSGPMNTASGLPLEAHKTVDQVSSTDIVIIPSLSPTNGEWQTGRYARMVEWLMQMYEQGAMLCSACSGVLLLAETGLLNGKEATVHWAYTHHFQKLFPEVRLLPEKALVASGDKNQFVMSGASTSWHDLVLYLIARFTGVTAAQAAAKFFAIQWLLDGLAPYVLFDPPTDHRDAAVENVQKWLKTHFAVANPIEEMVRMSGIPERTLKRRFTNATGYSPITYVQRLRVEEARRRLEMTGTSVDEISWMVGYEDAASFRRLFKRITGVTAGAYRRKFRVPSFARTTEPA
jgi:transcriptional regulator GlxA family with amidase domain